MALPSSHGAQVHGAQARLVEDLLDASVRQSERFICVARVIFCVVILGRRASFGGFWDGERVPVTALIMVPVVLAVALFSAWLALRARRPPLGLPLLFASVAVDALGCFIALASNAIGNNPYYQGVAAHPDVAALLLVIALAGFRLSPAAALFGAALNALSFVALVVIDNTHAAARIAPKDGAYFLLAICVVGTSAIAVGIARRARAMAVAAAAAAVQAERARTSLGTLLEEHHDIKSTLSAALLNAELMQRELSERGVLDAEGKRHATDLTRDLAAAQTAMRSLRARVLGEAVALDLPANVGVAVAIARAASVVAAKHPAVNVDVDVKNTTEVNASVALQARVAGGAASLERIALNLLLNACEGDGVRGATRIEVRARSTAAHVELHILDDGPGIVDKPERGSRKAEGSGLGLLIVESLVNASGGTVTLVNRADHARPTQDHASQDHERALVCGAHVVVTLPAAV